MQYDIWIEFTPLDDETPDDITHICIDTIESELSNPEDVKKYLLDTNRYNDNLLVTIHTNEFN